MTAPSTETAMADLERRATERYAQGDVEGAVACWERIHARRAATGEHGESARAAVMVAMHLIIDSGLMAPVRGWLTRADTLLSDVPEGPVHALAATFRGYERFFSGDLDSARPRADEAVLLGRRHDATAAVAVGRTLQARILLVDGELEAGLRALDEAGTYVMSGEIDALTVGMMLCEIICAAQSLAMPELAREWTDLMGRWQEGSAVGGIGGRCRVHRAELLRLSGPCDAAEAEALAACDALRPWLRREYGWPLVELGTIRLRAGDLDGAESAFREADVLAWSAQPGLALLALARGDVDDAVAMINDAVAHPPRLPWKERPPVGGLDLVPLLDAQAEIAQAGGDALTCATAADRLRDVAERHPSRGLQATALLAGARADLLTGDPARARRRATEAASVWSDLGAPYESSSARLVVAEALESLTDSTGAARERETALRAREAFRGRPSQVDPLTSRRESTFRREGDLRVVEHAGHRSTLSDLVGFRHLERLLARPGQDVAATDLVALENGGTRVTQSPLPILDEEARDAYRRRLAEVQADIAEAEEFHDLARAELAHRDRDHLIAELSRAVGLGGRPRTVGGDAERARMSVFRSIRYSLDRLAGLEPALADHLRRAVTTGSWCRYDPDPLTSIRWRLSEAPARR